MAGMVRREQHGRMADGGIYSIGTCGVLVVRLLILKVVSLVMAADDGSLWLVENRVESGGGGMRLRQEREELKERRSLDLVS